jgi:hypothetical protein
MLAVQAAPVAMPATAEMVVTAASAVPQMLQTVSRESTVSEVRQELVGTVATPVRAVMAL